VNLYAVSMDFLHDIQLVLLQFGIHSRVHPPAQTRPGGVGYLQLATGMDTVRFRDRIGIASVRKQAILGSYQHTRRGAKPFRPRVSKIEEKGPLPVADLSMPGDPSFVAGGIKVHNCFACGVQRDAVDTVREKEDLEFFPAINFLEKKYELPPLPWSDEDDKYVAPEDELEAMMNMDTTFDDERKRVSTFLDAMTQEKLVPLDVAFAFWEVFDKVSWEVDQERRGKSAGKVAMLRLLTRAKEHLKKHPVT